MTLQKKSLRVGDVVFSRSDSFYGLLIRFFTRSKYNHVGLVYNVDGDVVEVFEALSNGVVLKRYDLKSLQSVYRLGGKALTKKQKTCFDKFVKNSLGVEYDWRGIKYLSLKILSKGLFVFDRDTPNKVFCSELVSRVYLSCFGVDLVRRRVHDYVTPKDVYLSPFLFKVR